MNADLYQPHVGPNTAPKHHPNTNGNGVAAAAPARLEHTPKQQHQQQPETLHSNPVMNLDNILVELEHGGKDLLKIAHHHVLPKCGQDLRTEIRSVVAKNNKQQQGGGGGQQLLRLKKTTCSSKQSLLSQVRTTKPTSVLRHHHHHPAYTPKFSQALFQDIRASSHDDVVNTTKVLLLNNQHHPTMTNNKTINKQALLSEIRWAGRMRPRQVILRDVVRFAATNAKYKLLHPVQTVCRMTVWQDVRAMHGHACKHLPPNNNKEKGFWMMDIHNSHQNKARLAKTQTVNKQSLLSQIRSSALASLTHISIKSVQMFLSQVRSVHGHTKNTHHVATMNRRALMSGIRMMHGIAPKHLPLNKQGENYAWLMEIHTLPPLQLHHKQDLLSRIRSNSHSQMQVVMPKSIQMLLTELRAMHEHVIKKKTLHGTMNRSALLSDVRACHGNAPIHLPKNKDSWMMDIHSPHKLHHVKTTNKQALFTEIRTFASSSGRVFRHVAPKSIQMVLSQIRMVHNGHKMKHHSTKSCSALMTDIRACHGTAPKHLPKDSWMMEIQRPHSDLHHAETINKQGLLSEIRTSHPRMHHVVFFPKSNHDLMMQLRSMHGTNKHGPLHLRPCEPADRHSLMKDIRATHGYAIAGVSC